MANPIGKLGFNIIRVVVGIPIGIATHKLIKKVWLAARPDNPPRSAADPNVNWSDALGWAVLSAIGVAVAELATLKGAAEIWRTLTGSEPPVETPADDREDDVAATV